jgi:isopentenyl-diphosphate delta-isomerase
MEQIVVVDENDNPLGEEEKGRCHDGSGILHRAFLAMVFNRSGELLLTRRSDKKRLWPGFWDGTVASHVLKGEDYEQASRRRLVQEIGLTTDSIKYLFKFHYKAEYYDIGTEHEICAVTVVNNADFDRILSDSNEISEVKSAGMRALIDDIEVHGDQYTPWFILALAHMNGLQGGSIKDRTIPSCFERNP